MRAMPATRWSMCFVSAWRRPTPLIKGRAEGVGNAVYYVGAKTGRDGIHGATMASAEFDDRSAEKRPNVQVGDPFMEKLLLEACLEVMQTDALVGIQDMGAAGLTCSTCEMGARGNTGIEIDIRDVPQRETGMTPYEIMLSESQERMLFIVRRGREKEVEQIFEKWDLHAVRIGHVTDDGLLRVRDGGTLVAEMPNKALADEGPVYDRPMEPPADLAARQALDVDGLGPTVPPLEALKRLLASPQIASKRWVYRQYDHMVRTNSLVLAGMGAGVVRIKGTRRALGLLGGRQRTLLLSRPTSRRDAGGGRVGPQRRVRRSVAGWCHQLLELRQPGASRHHVAVWPGGRRHCRGLSRARDPDNGGQRQSVQRKPTALPSTPRRCSVLSG